MLEAGALEKENIGGMESGSAERELELEVFLNSLCLLAKPDLRSVVPLQHFGVKGAAIGDHTEKRALNDVS